MKTRMHKIILFLYISICSCSPHLEKNEHNEFSNESHVPFSMKRALELRFIGSLMNLSESGVEVPIPETIVYNPDLLIRPQTEFIPWTTRESDWGWETFLNSVSGANFAIFVWSHEQNVYSAEIKGKEKIKLLFQHIDLDEEKQKHPGMSGYLCGPNGVVALLREIDNEKEILGVLEISYWDQFRGVGQNTGIYYFDRVSANRFKNVVEKEKLSESWEIIPQRSCH